MNAVKFYMKAGSIVKKIFLILFATSTFCYATADENAPIYFQRDQRLGQFNTVFKIAIHGSLSQSEKKICFVSDRLKDDPVNGKLQVGCTAKKLKDSATDLEYLVSCTGQSDTDLHWIRTSENEYSFSSKNADLEITSTYQYVGTTCDADAILK